MANLCYNEGNNLSETPQVLEAPNGVSDHVATGGLTMANSPILQSPPNSDNSKALPTVEIYCDGACDPNPGAGGIGAVLLFGSHRREISEPIGRATNNTAELQAAITALMALNRRCAVTVYSDSRYLVSTMNGDFRKSTNLELWNDLEFAAMKHEITWTWVKGHNGNPHNERAHQLAEAAVRRNGKTA